MEGVASCSPFQSDTPYLDDAAGLPELAFGFELPFPGAAGCWFGLGVVFLWPNVEIEFVR